MAKITVLTRVHNPGKNIYQCVDSVLNQTFEDFKFVIVDNASSDGTKEVLQEYAKKDNRICLMRNESNDICTLYCMQNYVDTEYFMVLDHDDWLEKNALEDLYNYAKSGNLDIVFGKTDFWENGDKYLSTRGFNQEVEITVEDLCIIFPYVYAQLRTTWAKLISRKLVPFIDEESYYYRRESKYGADTIMMLSMVFSANKVGFLNTVIHNYRVHINSSSFSFCKEHFMADWFLFDYAKGKLEANNGFTKNNERFLYAVYCSAIIDTLSVAIKSKQDAFVVMEVMLEIIKDYHTKELILISDGEEIGKSKLLEWVHKFKGLYGENVAELSTKLFGHEMVSKIITAWHELIYGKLSLNARECELLYRDAELSEVWCSGQILEVYDSLFSKEKYADEQYARIKLCLLLNVEKDFVRLSQRLLLLENQINDMYVQIPAYLEYMMKYCEMLQGISLNECFKMPEIVLRIAAKKYHEALEICLSKMQENNGLSNVLLQLALRLSAVLEYADIFVDLKKYECALLIESANKTAAEEVLRDLEDMCPGDGQISELREQINNIG